MPGETIRILICHGQHQAALSCVAYRQYNGAVTAGGIWRHHVELVHANLYQSGYGTAAGFPQILAVTVWASGDAVTNSPAGWGVLLRQSRHQKSPPFRPVSQRESVPSCKTAAQGNVAFLTAE